MSFRHSSLYDYITSYLVSPISQDPRAIHRFPISRTRDKDAFFRRPIRAQISETFLCSFGSIFVARLSVWSSLDHVIIVEVVVDDDVIGIELIIEHLLPGDWSWHIECRTMPLMGVSMPRHARLHPHLHPVDQNFRVLVHVSTATVVDDEVLRIVDDTGAGLDRLSIKVHDLFARCPEHPISVWYTTP